MKNRVFFVGLTSLMLQSIGLADTLKGAFAEHFLMGTVWHGQPTEQHKKNHFLEKEKAITALEFNTITAENCMKPAALQPEQGAFNFAESDAMMAYAQAQDLVVVGHTLVWKNATPSWFFLDKHGAQVSRDVLIARLETHIRTVVEHYRGRIAYWDVVNEAIDTRWLPKQKRFEAFYKPTPWLEIIGPEYIEIAYRAAHKADPSVKLLYNDYGLHNEAKLDFALAMIADLKSRGVQVDGLGYQGHLFIDQPALGDIERVLSKARQAQIPLHITELDVSVLPNAWKHRAASVEDRFALAAEFNPYVDGVPEDILTLQAKRYSELFKLLVKYSDNVERVTFWGVWDGNSWRDYRPMLGRTDYPLLIGRNFERKPAYSAVLQVVTEQEKKD